MSSRYTVPAFRFKESAQRKWFFFDTGNGEIDEDRDLECRASETQAGIG